MEIVSKVCLETELNHISKLLFVCCKGPRRNLRNDLLIAADSITNTMSSLVKELNSGAVIVFKKLVFVTFCTTDDLLSPFSPIEGGSETESTVDSDFGRGDLLATTSSDPFFNYKPRSISEILWDMSSAIGTKERI